MNTVSLYDGDVTLRFNPEQHRYYARVCGEDRGRVINSTSITGVIAKPALQYWAANETAKYFEKNLEPGRRYDEIQIAEMVERSKRARFSSSSKALSIGSLVHDWIEAYVKRQMNGGCIVVPNSETTDERHLAMPLNDTACGAIRQFLEWEASFGYVYWLQAERKVYSMKHHYAGTLDGEAIIEGHRCLIDFKTSKDIYSEYLIQGAAYVAARQEEQKYIGEPVQYDKIIILRTPKDGADFEVREVSDHEEIADHFRAFLACLHLKQWQKQYG